MKLVIGILGLIALLFACQETESVDLEQKLPKLGNADINYETGDTIFPTIIPFEYLNQDSIMVTSESMKGKVWIADFFFTSCPTICPTMTTQMKRLSAMTADLEKEIQFMSFSINPTNDQPHVLRRYQKKHGIDAKNWYFFTGDEAATHELGTEYFLVNADADGKSPGGFAHSPAFTLVDRSGYVRGVYDGTDTKQVDQLEKDVRQLLRQEYGVK